jgi:uncharacterized delta-60 repeat protein
VTTDFSINFNYAEALVLQLDGKILVGGYAYILNFGYQFALARYNRDGSLDTSFGIDGLLTTDMPGDTDYANSMVLQPDGKIVLAGWTGEDIALARYK